MITNRRLAAIMVVDVVGSSRLMERDEAQALSAMRTCWSDIVEPLVKDHSGRVVKYTGDGLLAEFGSAVKAVECGLAIQEGMAMKDSGVPDENRIVFRIGINVGDVVGEGSDILGDGVNVAARIEALAQPGGLCITSNVQEAIHGKVAVREENLGEQQLKNISRPIRVFRIAARSGEISAQPSQIAHDERTVVAVLPFTNMSGDPEQDYFADGITEDIITELSRSRHLAVLARNTMFSFKGKSVNVVDVGRQLKANFVIEGSVRQVGNRVRATVQLIDAETGAHTFAEKFDREITHIFEVQDEIVTLVIGRLSFGLDEAAAVQRTRGRSNSASAYTLFLKARAAWRNGDEESAVKFLEGSVAIDPNYARALGYLAFFKADAAATSNTAESTEDLKRVAEEYAERALKSGKGDPYTLQRAAVAYLLIGKPKLARSYIDAAALDSPHDLEITHVRGLVLAFNGLHEEGRELVEQSIRADPRCPPAFYGTLAEMRFLCGDYLGAIEVMDRIPVLQDWMSVVKALSLVMLGRHSEAQETVGHLVIDWEYRRNWMVMCLREETAKRFNDAFDRRSALIRRSLSEQNRVVPLVNHSTLSGCRFP